MAFRAKVLTKEERQLLINRMAQEGKLVQKGSPEDRAKHQQEVMESMKEARARANRVKLKPMKPNLCPKCQEKGKVTGTVDENWRFYKCPQCGYGWARHIHVKDTDGVLVETKEQYEGRKR